VLEEYEYAKARGAEIYCELTGYGMSGDAFHMTQPSKNGDGAKRCMNAALNDAGLNPTDIGYINAHGTSTGAGDVAETNAVNVAMKHSLSNSFGFGGTNATLIFSQI